MTNAAGVATSAFAAVVLPVSVCAVAGVLDNPSSLANLLNEILAALLG